MLQRNERKSWFVVGLAAALVGLTRHASCGCLGVAKSVYILPLSQSGEWSHLSRCLELRGGTQAFADESEAPDPLEHLLAEFARDAVAEPRRRYTTEVVSNEEAKEKYAAWLEENEPEVEGVTEPMKRAVDNAIKEMDTAMKAIGKHDWKRRLLRDVEYEIPREVVRKVFEDDDDVENAGAIKLIRAAKTGDITALSGLLSQELNLDFQDKSFGGWTAMHWASISGKPSAVALLSIAGASTNSVSVDNQSPLHLAALENHGKTAKTLLEHGANATLQDKSGRTALHVAASRGSTAVVRSILDSGTNISTQDNEGNTAAQLALSHGHPAIWELLQRHEDTACKGVDQIPEYSTSIEDLAIQH